MSAPGPSRRGRPPVQSLTPHILAAARQHLAEAGVENFSVRQVAELACVARKSIANRWSSPEELLLACLGSVDSFDFTPSGRLRDDLIAIGTKFVEGLASEALDLQLRLTAEAGVHPEAYRAMQVHVLQPMSRALDTAFGASQDARGLTSDDCAWLIRAFIGALLAKTFSSPSREAPTPEDVEELATRICAWTQASTDVAPKR